MIVPPRARGARRFQREGRSPSAIGGGGLAADGTAWVASRPGFLLPVGLLSRLFRRRFLEGLAALAVQGREAFFGDHARLAEPAAFARWLAPRRAKPWVVYAKPPFAGPESVLAYLARYTHRVASGGRRANLTRARELLAVPAPEVAAKPSEDAAIGDHRPPCPCCGGHMVIVERFEPGNEPRGPPSARPRSAAA